MDFLLVQFDFTMSQLKSKAKVEKFMRDEMQLQIDEIL